MTFNKELVDKFLDAVFPLPDNFGIVMKDWDTEPIYFGTFKKAVYSIDEDAKVEFGVSKIVIISPKLEVVIKIPFNGYFSIADEEADGLNWNPFMWATGSDSSDYCLAEYEKYKQLKSYKLNCFVAKTLYYKTINGIRIFLQEKVTPRNNLYNIYKHKPSKQSKDIACKWYDDDKITMNTDWVASCIDIYGKNKVERFLNYCANIDLDILDDVHSGNYGYRENGTPCILDYSNYADD